MYLTHLMFIDDVILFTNDYWFEVRVLQDILKILSMEIVMMIKTDESIVSFNGVDERVAQELQVIFNFRSRNFCERFKYLGYILKPNSYGKLVMVD